MTIIPPRCHLSETPHKYKCNCNNSHFFIRKYSAFTASVATMKKMIVTNITVKTIFHEVRFLTFPVIARFSYKWRLTFFVENNVEHQHVDAS